MGSLTIIILLLIQLLDWKIKNMRTLFILILITHLKKLLMIFLRSKWQNMQEIIRVRYIHNRLNNHTQGVLIHEKMLTWREVSSCMPQGYFTKIEKKKKEQQKTMQGTFIKPVDERADKETWSSKWLSLDSKNHPTEELLEKSEMFNQEKKDQGRKIGKLKARYVDDVGSMKFLQERFDILIKGRIFYFSPPLSL